MRLILHVGLPKTGTTTIQQAILPRLPNVNMIGKTHKKTSIAKTELSILQEKLIFNITQNDGIEFDHKNVNAIANKFHSQLKNTKHPIIWSNEALTTANRVDRSIIAQRLFTYVRPDKILISLRDPLLALKSQHFHAVRAGKVNNACFVSWLEDGIPFGAFNSMHKIDNRIKQYCYPNLINKYLSIFGADNVSIIYLEDLTNNNRIFANTICGTLNLDFSIVYEICQLASNARHNSAPNLNKILRLFTCNRVSKYARANSSARLRLNGYTNTKVHAIYTECRRFLMRNVNSMPRQIQNDFQRLGYLDG